jgi:hypothetical protein
MTIRLKGLFVFCLLVDHGTTSPMNPDIAGEAQHDLTVDTVDWDVFSDFDPLESPPHYASAVAFHSYIPADEGAFHDSDVYGDFSRMSASFPSRDRSDAPISSTLFDSTLPVRGREGVKRGRPPKVIDPDAPNCEELKAQQERRAAYYQKSLARKHASQIESMVSRSGEYAASSSDGLSAREQDRQQLLHSQDIDVNTDPEEALRLQRKQERRVYQRKYRASMNEEQVETFRQRQRLAQRTYLGKMTPEQKKEHFRTLYRKRKEQLQMRNG